MPLVKFAGASDPRFLATLDRIGDELVNDSSVRRLKATRKPPRTRSPGAKKAA